MYHVRMDLYNKYIHEMDQMNDANQIEQLPLFNEEWRLGRFQIVINHCSNCSEHQNTFKHSESTFGILFNRIGQQLRDQYPNIEIVGNFDKPAKILEHFEIYMRGVGAIVQRDKLNRIFLFKKTCSLELFIKKFDKYMLQVNDSLASIIMGYGDTVELGKAQELFMNQNTDIYIKSDFSHGFPFQFEESQQHHQRSSENPLDLQTGQQMICNNWTCNKAYSFEENASNRAKNCRHHPGVFEFGSTNGLWPEHWTCCRKDWLSLGCTVSFHQGEPTGKNIGQQRYCVNRGELNPKTNYPDSCCGSLFNTKEVQGCQFHRGYKLHNKLTASESWSCCDSIDDPPCVNDDHVYVTWPNQQAKLLFIRKPLLDPTQSNHPLISYKKAVLHCDFYKKCKPYNEELNRKKEMDQKLIDTQDEKRYCLNWACEKKFTHHDNQKNPHMCRFHPGRFDFGHTGLTLQETYNEYNKLDSEKILWRPHWTCCRAQWTNDGCQKGKHRGPLVNEMGIRKYIWPSEQAMKYFWKVSSPLWQKKLIDEGVFDLERVSKVFDHHRTKSGGQISLSEVILLCDTLKLSLAVCYSDLTFHFKFLDIINNNLSMLTKDSSTIDKQLFIQWWFADLDTIRPLDQQQ